MRCERCIALGRLYCFFDEDKEVPKLTLEGLPRVVAVPKVVV